MKNRGKKIRRTAHRSSQRVKRLRRLPNVETLSRMEHELLVMRYQACSERDKLSKKRRVEYIV